MEARQLGDYRLLDLLARLPDRDVWHAEQSSIHRKAIVIELTDFTQREVFLAEGRAKAAVDLPLVGSVYEAASDDEQCFIVLEHLTTPTLSDHQSAGETLSPALLVKALRGLSETMLQFQLAGVRTKPLTLAAIHLDERGTIRIENIACAGAPKPEHEIRDVTALGAALPGLISDSLPGATRLLTVCAWMRGEGVSSSLTWKEIHRYALQIEDQLQHRGASGAATKPGQSRRKRSVLPLLGMAGLGVALLIGAGVFLHFQNEAERENSVRLPAPVTIPAGTHPAPDGGVVELAGFRLAAHEVTLGEYAEFLESLEKLPYEERGKYDREGQPAEKINHRPDDWEAMRTAARKKGTWNGMAMDFRCPVVNVDWWDAVAYCTWKGGRLPTPNEWYAALRLKFEQPETLQPSPWQPLSTAQAIDRTPAGLLDMAGSVSEWTLEPTVNPANPIGDAEYVIMGGSWKEPARGALTREWTTDRLLRRPDLGFRILFPEAGEKAEGGAP